MSHPPSADTSRSASAVTAILALLQLGCGLVALRATVIHAGNYPSATQWWIEMLVFSFVCVNGLALLRRRRWAVRTTLYLVYISFFAVLVAISLAFDGHHENWWYWGLPLALPLLGWCAQMLRKPNHASPPTRHR